MNNENKLVSNIQTNDFDGDKILSKYKTMTKEEAIGLLGEKYAPILIERIKNRNISFKEFSELCNQAFPNSPQRANWIKSIIYNKLSKYEGLSMHGIEPEKIKTIAKLDDYKDKIQKGTINQNELKELCDLTFGKDSEESNMVYNQMNHLVQPNEVTNQNIETHPQKI